MPPAAAAVVAVAASVAVETAVTAVIGGIIAETAVGAALAGVGESVLALEAIDGTIMAATAFADAATGVIAGAAGGMASSLVTGGDPLTGALFGGAGALAGPVFDAATQAAGLGSISSMTGDVGQFLSSTAGKIGLDITPATATKAVTGLASGTAMGLAKGQNLGQALESGAIRGGVSGAFSELGLTPGKDASVGEKIASGVGQSLASSGLQSLLQPSGASTSPTPSGTTTQQAPPSPSDGGQSAVLGSALGTVSNLGYSPTGPIFGTSDDDKSKRSTWNIGSLRSQQEDNAA